MTDDPKIPTQPIEEPNERPDEVPPQGDDMIFPGGSPAETPQEIPPQNPGEL